MEKEPATDHEGEEGRVARWVGWIAAGAAILGSEVCLWRAWPDRAQFDALVFATQWAWLAAFGAALVQWLRGTGSGLRFSLRNPARRSPAEKRVPVRFTDGVTLRGDGTLDVTGGRVLLSGWTLRPWWPWMCALLAAAQASWSYSASGTVIAMHALLAASLGWHLSRRRSRMVLTAGELESAGFLRGSVVLKRRDGAPIHLTVRESRAVELAVWLRDAGIDVRTPAEPNPNRPSPPPDLDGTLARLRETNERLASR